MTKHIISHFNNWYQNMIVIFTGLAIKMFFLSCIIPINSFSATGLKCVDCKM